MTDLKMFGFPVKFDCSDNTLKPGENGVSFLDYSRKPSVKMFGLLADESYKTEDDIYYDFYKSIGRDSERGEFEKLALRYDSTVIMPGCAGREYKKTAGHFHCTIPGHSVSYPEYYQVVSGKALFVMQKVADDHAEGKIKVEDAILCEVNAGEAIVVPPEYGHCTVNIGDEPMIFINLVACDSHNYYDSVKHSTGMCCWIMKDGAGYSVEKNPAYDFAGQPRITAPRDNAKIGIVKDVPVYSEYLADPAKFKYLSEPEASMDDFMSVFADE